MLMVCNVNKSYRKNNYWFSNQYQQVLNQVSFTIAKGECLGIVGESGSGKSTLARLILGLEKADSGNIIWRQTESNDSVHMSAVFQDYVSSVNPTMNVSDIILEPLNITKIAIDNPPKFVAHLLDTVGLPTNFYSKYPHELSGGQLQRLCIARALSIHPKFIVLDEPTSSLDMINQLKILDLLKQLKHEFQLSYLFISHDLQATTYLCNNIAFLYKGQIIEQIETINLSKVKSDYAKKLLSSVSNK